MTAVSARMDAIRLTPWPTGGSWYEKGSSALETVRHGGLSFTGDSLNGVRVVVVPRLLFGPGFRFPASDCRFLKVRSTVSRIPPNIEMPG